MNTHTEEDHKYEGQQPDPMHCYICYSDRINSQREIDEFVPTIRKIEDCVKQYRDGIVLPHEMIAMLLDSISDYV